LKKPAPLRIGRVVALNKANQLGVLQAGAFAVRKIAGGLRRQITQPPLATLVQAQPAIAVRHIGPLAHGLFYDGIHYQLL